MFLRIVIVSLNRGCLSVVCGCVWGERGDEEMGGKEMDMDGKGVSGLVCWYCQVKA